MFADNSQEFEDDQKGNEFETDNEDENSDE